MMDRAPEPTNDHERTIAEAIDNKTLTADGSYESVMAETVMAMPFDMSIADVQFLFDYLHWRLTHQVKKQSTHGTLRDDLKRSG